ncbi:MAG: hypothetical protein ABMA01_11890 [Chthoniobacteraceae bacterium]
MELIIRRRAAYAIQEIFARYEGEQPGLGFEFLELHRGGNLRHRTKPGDEPQILPAISAAPAQALSVFALLPGAWFLRRPLRDILRQPQSERTLRTSRRQRNMSEKRKSNTLRAFEPATGGPAWREAEAAGCDMSLLVASARMSVWERICEHRAAIDLATTLREAWRKASQQEGTPSA